MLSVPSKANTDNMTNPDVLLSLWREQNLIISDTETETEEETSYIAPEETSQTMETITGKNIPDCQFYDRRNTPDQD